MSPDGILADELYWAEPETCRGRVCRFGLRSPRSWSVESSGGHRRVLTAGHRRGGVASLADYSALAATQRCNRRRWDPGLASRGLRLLHRVLRTGESLVPATIGAAAVWDAIVHRFHTGLMAGIGLALAAVSLGITLAVDLPSNFTAAWPRWNDHLLYVLLAGPAAAAILGCSVVYLINGHCGIEICETGGDGIGACVASRR